MPDRAKLAEAIHRAGAEAIAAHERYLGEAPAKLAEVAEIFVRALRDGRKLLFFGNGGSAADAQHVAAELVGRYQREREPFAAIALTTDTSILTAIGNDYAYAEVFARQVKALARSGDVAIGISTSGKSPNVLRGLEEARRAGCTTVGFTGAAESPIVAACDVCFRAPADVTSRIQELHLLAWHSICNAVEAAMTGESL